MATGMRALLDTVVQALPQVRTQTHGEREEHYTSQIKTHTQTHIHTCKDREGVRFSPSVVKVEQTPHFFFCWLTSKSNRWLIMLQTGSLAHRRTCALNTHTRAHTLRLSSQRQRHCWDSRRGHSGLETATGLGGASFVKQFVCLMARCPERVTPAAFSLAAISGRWNSAGYFCGQVFRVNNKVTDRSRQTYLAAAVEWSSICEILLSEILLFKVPFEHHLFISSQKREMFQKGPQKS